MSSTSIITFLILSIAVGYIFIMPAYQEIGGLSDQKAKYEDYLATATNIENKTNELKTKFNQISASDKKNIDTVLPDSFDFVKLIAQIDEVAKGQGVRVERTSFRVVDPAVGTSIAEAAPNKSYDSAIVSFSFNASYAGFNNLINSLEKSLRILDVRSVKIGSVAESGLYTFTLELETYWLKTQ